MKNYEPKEFFEGAMVAHFTMVKYWTEYWTGFMKGFVDSYEQNLRNQLGEKVSVRSKKRQLMMRKYTKCMISSDYFVPYSQQSMKCENDWRIIYNSLFSNIPNIWNIADPIRAKIRNDL